MKRINVTVKYSESSGDRKILLSKISKVRLELGNPQNTIDQLPFGVFDVLYKVVAIDQAMLCIKLHKKIAWVINMIPCLYVICRHFTDKDIDIDEAVFGNCLLHLVGSGPARAPHLCGSPSPARRGSGPRRRSFCLLSRCSHRQTK